MRFAFHGSYHHRVESARIHGEVMSLHAPCSLGLPKVLESTFENTLSKILILIVKISLLNSVAPVV